MSDGPGTFSRSKSLYIPAVAGLFLILTCELNVVYCKGTGEPAPFVDLSIGVTEDRLLGGLQLESTLKGNLVLKPGLLSEAHSGVLYIDEVNLLPSHLGDALLDAVSSGVNVVEREGFSASHPAEFVLLGSMNPEEGLLRPQLFPAERYGAGGDEFSPKAYQVDLSKPIGSIKHGKLSNGGPRGF